MTTQLCLEVANSRLGSAGYRSAVGILDGRNQAPQESRIRDILAGTLTAEDLPALRSIWSQAQHRLERFLQRVDLRGIDLTEASPNRRETIARQGGGDLSAVDACQLLTGRAGREAIRLALVGGGSDAAILAASMLDGQMGDLAYALQCVPEIARQHQHLTVVTINQVRRLQDLLWGAAQVLPYSPPVVDALKAVDALAATP